jgi:hypothetical protein
MIGTMKLFGWPEIYRNIGRRVEVLAGNQLTEQLFQNVLAAAQSHAHLDCIYSRNDFIFAIGSYLTPGVGFKNTSTPRVAKAACIRDRA